MSNVRLRDRFAALKAQRRTALVTYVMACDPDRATSQAILNGLPAAGADVIELGMPFSDPMADGPTIQAAAQRSIKAGGTLRATLDMVAEFRTTDTTTPVVLMGYYNPIHACGPAAFCALAARAGVDGLIVVDVPPEEADGIVPHARRHGIDWIALTTPTTDAVRLPTVLSEASGFVYYVSVAGVTGAAAADPASIRQAVERIRARTALPVCVGFGIRTPEQAAQLAPLADGVVVGSSLVDAAAKAVGSGDPVTASLTLVRQLGKALDGA